MAHDAALPDMDTEGVTVGVTVSVMVLLITGLTVVQAAVLVITTAMASLLLKEASV